MTDSYMITITNTRTGVAVATATVEIDGTSVRMTEVGAEISGEHFVPEALATVDFPFLVHTANILSGAPAKGDPAAEPAPPAQEGESKPEGKPSAAPPPASNRSVIPTDTSLPERLSEGRERARLKRDQRAGAPADFGVTYWRLGSISKVAKHYDVPHHIAQDWIKSLQQQGKLASPWPSKSVRPLRPK
ncbi:hypothetical protein ACIP5Y_00105 [Nocardia sp. NPDC088792]|uniref:hypothetical protein n=1 Tax=Nocardia sp. NPDC088792 TaxID=3364332 RepID=UPI0038265620